VNNNEPQRHREHREENRREQKREFYISLRIAIAQIFGERAIPKAKGSLAVM